MHRLWIPEAQQATTRLMLILGALSPAGCAAKPPTVDIVAEESAVRQRDAGWWAAEKRRDTDAAMSFVAENGVIHEDGHPAITGRESLRDAYKEFFAIPYTDFSVEPRAITVAASGDLALDIGSWKIIVDENGKKSELPGKSTIVWKKVNGEWKVVACAVTMDTPPAPAPPAGKVSRKA